MKQPSKRSSRKPASVSMQDVAKLAGVSAQTVSRVANGRDDVRPETRLKVERAMRELGYRPNYAARALKHGSFRDVGVVLFDMTTFGNAHILNGVVDAAREHGYATTIRTFDAGAPATLAGAYEQMKQLPVDGVVFILERKVADFNEFRPSAELPVVLISEEPSDHCPTVDTDQYGTSVALVDYLLSCGHRNVYHIAGPSSSVAAQSRMRGWRDALIQHGMTPPSIYIGDWEADSGYQAGLALAHERDCTAVYAANDQMAYGCMLGLREAGKDVPGDVSVVGVDDALRGVVPRLELTTMHLKFNELGRAAFDMVLQQCDGSRLPVGVKTVIPPVLVERTSVRTIETV